MHDDKDPVAISPSLCYCVLLQGGEAHGRYSDGTVRQLLHPAGNGSAEAVGRSQPGAAAGQAPGGAAKAGAADRGRSHDDDKRGIPGQLSLRLQAGMADGKRTESL